MYLKMIFLPSDIPYTFKFQITVRLIEKHQENYTVCIFIQLN